MPKKPFYSAKFGVTSPPLPWLHGRITFAVHKCGLPIKCILSLVRRTLLASRAVRPSNHGKTLYFRHLNPSLAFSFGQPQVLASHWQKLENHYHDIIGVSRDPVPLMSHVRRPELLQWLDRRILGNSGRQNSAFVWPILLHIRGWVFHNLHRNLTDSVYINMLVLHL